MSTKEHGFGLEVRIEYQVDQAEDGSFEVRSKGYAFVVLERHDREILAFHWHPFGISSMRTPHLHLSTRIPRFDLDPGISVNLAGMHIPTGFVTLADVVRLLIAEFGVETRRHDWPSILDRADS